MRVDAMDTFAPIVNEAYREYADLLLQHHRRLAEGEESADETIRVEDAMTELWDRLDPIQRKSLSGLGSDLNWVRQGARPAPLAPRPEDVSPEARKALDEARNASNWHTLLHQLRLCGSAIPANDLARLRAEAWLKLGEPQIARIFQELVPHSPEGSSSSRPRPRG
jgi:hypothetical protein